jgi:hypothetical protein
VLKNGDTPRDHRFAAVPGAFAVQPRSDDEAKQRYGEEERRWINRETPMRPTPWLI